MAVTIHEEDLKEDYKSVFQYWDDFLEYRNFRILRLQETGNHVYYEPKKGPHETYLPFCHSPELKEYQVWMEGYQETGVSMVASLWGKAKARNFAEACHKVACANYLKSIKLEETKEKLNYTAGRWDYDPARLTYWGCNLYWNEKDARRAFG
jgi:hypothetical protein